MVNTFDNNVNTSSRIWFSGKPSIYVYLIEIMVLLNRKLQKSVNCTYDKYDETL